MPAHFFVCPLTVHKPLVLQDVFCSHICAGSAARAPVNASQHSVYETIRLKRGYHTPPDPEAEKLGFRGWHSRGYLPHFDMPGVMQMLNYRLDDAMPANRRREWEVLLQIDNELKRRTRIEE